MKLRSQLILLTLAALLPIAVLAAILGAFLIDHQRETFRRGTEARVLAISTAVDSELRGSIDTLNALAHVRSLDQGDLQLFRESAAQVLATQEHWLTINLALPDGQQVVNVRVPEGVPLPKFQGGEGTLLRLTQSLKPVVDNLVVGRISGRWDFGVRVPVVRDGRLLYVLSAVVNPDAIARLVNAQGLPDEWQGTVLDRGGRTVARTIDSETSVGQLPSEGLRQAMAGSATGWFRGSTREGREAYRAYRRSDATGWTFAMAIPVPAVEAAANRAIWIFGLSLAGAIALAVVLAQLIGRRITKPITALAAATDRLAQGERVEIKESAHLGELRALETALRNAAGAQIALQFERKRLDLALAAGKMGVYEWNPIDRVCWWSPEVYSMHGVSSGSFDPAMDAVKLVHPGDLEKVMDIPRAIEQYRPWIQEYRIIRPDGEVRWLASRAETEYGEHGGGQRFYGVIMDITERKEVEEALRDADRHKDEFLAMLSHELRNPLAALTTAAYVLRGAAPDDSTTAGAQGVIERQTEHMVRLIEDLLDITRVRLGKLSLKRVPLDLAELISEVTQSRGTAGLLAARATVSLDLSPVWINGDRVRLEQVYSNLLQNALKFTPANGAIRVSLRQEGNEGVLRVADTGRGINADVLPTIFEPFVQGKQNLDRAQGGLGLGLALVKRLTELHEGSVTAESSGEGFGTTFTVTLPAVKPPQEPWPAVPSRVAHDLQPLRVLVIEDNQDARQMLRVLLTMEGHEVREAVNGTAGIQAAADMNPDVVLLDIGLPDLDGYEVARRLRAGPGGHSMVLVALSGYGQDDDRGQTRDAGFDAHLVKPTSAERLGQIITELVARTQVTAK